MLFSEPKIPQGGSRARFVAISWPCFSALQRAENSSRAAGATPAQETGEFQCSSASRKFLKRILVVQKRQRDFKVSVLFSEPKIPQATDGAFCVVGFVCFSALQRAENSSSIYDVDAIRVDRGFSALQRAENSSRKPQTRSAARSARVSVLFSEPKIPQV